MKAKINLNGTSARELIAAQLRVKETATELHKALMAACPNGRDYQHAGGPADLMADLSSWRGAYEAVTAIHRRADATLEALAAQPGGAKAWAEEGL